MVELSIAEQNARAGALGRFIRWLYRRYQKLDLVELANLPDPIELRQVFVPLRVGEEDLQDEAMGRDVEDVRKEELPGEDAWDLLAREPFVLLSGRPGSGKTTLVQAIVAELCSDRPSRFRDATGAVPIPLILRTLGKLDQVKSLDGLLDLWWPLQADQAERDRLPLDVRRLRERLFPPQGLPDVPVLLLFDGIDEIGGRHVRQQLLKIAEEGLARGYRVLVTGRPTGFRDLAGPTWGIDFGTSSVEVPRRSLHHLLPFAWPQIDQFIQSWYGLRDEWERQRRQGIERFLNHLADRNRQHMLSLARRPIFLTLMALVHCTQNQMPEGRPLLYKQIIDLYLERQERHRQREWAVDGTAMPHWPSAETRLVLAHLAWKSQIRGAEGERSRDPESRRVVWKRGEVEKVVRSQIEQRLGRFDVLQPADAPALVNYFLHPAGLLIEPAEGEIQFAHLSFQEYLCAWYLHEQGKMEEMKPYLQASLYPNLAKPGWDEVGLLLFCIHAEEMGRQGHFRLLRGLDLAQPAQADLFVAALTGRELPFSEAERRAWLPAAFACALIHPRRDYGRKLAQVPEWKEDARALLSSLAKADDARGGMWTRLRDAPRPGSLGRAEPPKLTREMESRWSEPLDDETWNVFFGAEEARAHAFLRLCNSGWYEGTDLRPIQDPELENRLAEWLAGRLAEAGPSLLWVRRNENLPIPTEAALELDGLLPDRGGLWRLVTRQIPLDGWLLQGERYESYFYLNFAQPSVLLTLRPPEILAPRNVLALLLYQAQIVMESAAEGRVFHQWIESLSRSLSRSLEQSRSQSQSQSRSQSQSQSQSLSRSQSRSLSLELSRSRSLSRWRWLSLERSRSQSLSRSLSLSLSQPTRSVLDRFLTEFEKLSRFEAELDEPFYRLSSFGLRTAALDWFSEQSGDPELMRRRGLHPGEPLPRALGFFDEKGIPFPMQKRESWLKLRDWLLDDNAILSFAFPQGLPEDEGVVLLEDLEILRQQPWSPDKGVEALLAGWPEAEAEREVTLEAGDRAVREACEKALAILEPPKERGKVKKGPGGGPA